MSVIVLKFGGQTLRTPKLIKSAAQRAVDLKKQGHSLIIVVSAMGDSTNQLLNMAQEISSQPCRREMDMLVTAGERISMALLSMSLHDLGCPAISFTGSQAGILTTNSHSGAQIKELKPTRVENALKEDKIVVLAGFQGVSPQTKEITTLGRGGSDMTAVVFAAHFKAERCEILKDVDGVHSYDPNRLSNSYLIKTIPSESFSTMTLWGSGVLYYKAAKLVEENKVPLTIRSAFNNTSGTQILHENKEPLKWISVSSHEQVWFFKKDLDFSYDNLQKICQEHNASPITLLHEDQKQFCCTTHTQSYSLFTQFVSDTFSSNFIKKESSVTLVANAKIDESNINKVLTDFNYHQQDNWLYRKGHHYLTFFTPQEKQKNLIKKIHQFVEL